MDQLYKSFSFIHTVHCILNQFRYVSLQGKGMQMTYWLVGKDGYGGPLPALDE